MGVEGRWREWEKVLILHNTESIFSEFHSRNRQRSMLSRITEETKTKQRTVKEFAFIALRVWKERKNAAACHHAQIFLLYLTVL